MTERQHTRFTKESACCCTHVSVARSSSGGVFGANPVFSIYETQGAVNKGGDHRHAGDTHLSPSVRGPRAVPARPRRGGAPRARDARRARWVFRPVRRYGTVHVDSCTATRKKNGAICETCRRKMRQTMGRHQTSAPDRWAPRQKNRTRGLRADCRAGARQRQRAAASSATPTVSRWRPRGLRRWAPYVGALGYIQVYG